jgi:hypothetical protein
MLRPASMKARIGEPADLVGGWLQALEERHLADLTPSEVTRALRALSSCYVERREKLPTGGALDGAGKRAAFALFYGPQHFLITREIVARVAAPRTSPILRVMDLGCGTGSAGAAAALATGAREVEGFDVNAWAVREAAWTYKALDLDGRAVVANLSRVRLHASPGTFILAAYAVNELLDDDRASLLLRLMDAQRKGAAVLVVEPIGRRANRWWDGWADTFVGGGGREDVWRFGVPLPPRQRMLAKGAGLSVQELTARSLYVEGAAA